MLSYVRSTVLLVALVIGGPGHAEPPDNEAISALLHGMFDKPNVQLTVTPVVVAGDHAIADWAQGDLGGRALLRRKPKAWALILCAGDAIKTEEALERVGVPAGDAARLERELAAAEARLGPKDVAMFSRFDGLVMMKGSPEPAGHTHSK